MPYICPIYTDTYIRYRYRETGRKFLSQSSKVSLIHV